MISVYDGTPVDASTDAFKRPGVRGLLAGKGFELCRRPADADILILHSRYMDKRALGSGKPFILYSAGDSTDYSAGTLSHGVVDKCAAVLKMYWRDSGGPCGLSGGRWFLRTLPGYDASDETVVDRTAVHDKVMPCWEFLHYDKLRGFLDIPPPGGQEIMYKAHFAGTVQYGALDNQASRLVTEHRRGCADTLESIYGKDALVVRGRGLSHKDYMDSMSASRVVVSPFGWGEACYRDYEAVMAGAALVKPRCGWVRCFSDLYRRDGVVHYCSPDWSDLEKVVEEASCKSGEARLENALWLRGEVACTENTAAGLVLDALRKAKDLL